MIKMLIAFFAILIGGMILLNTGLQNGSILNYLDTHPDPRWIPALEYYAGEVFYGFQNLHGANVLFSRVSEHYPKSPFADDALFDYVQTLDDEGNTSRRQLAGLYLKYIERFPQGKHATIAQNRADYYRTGSR